jgi:hypothetical protein
MLQLNVGGTLFETCEKTLSKCKNIPIGSLDRNQIIFIDHDPDVFKKTLKILRGYPCDDETGDPDVLYQLSMLGHEFLETELPVWMQKATRELVPSIHTLDPEQATTFGATHILVSVAVMDRMIQMGLLPKADYVKCRVVGVKHDWEDCMWVSKKHNELAKKKIKFINYFNSI